MFKVSITVVANLVSRVNDYASIKHLSFGTNVAGRTDEFIVYNPTYVFHTINKLDIKKDYWLTVLSNEEPNIYVAITDMIRVAEDTSLLY